MENTRIITPENPLFHFTLATCPPPGKQPDQLYFVVDAESGLIRNADNRQVTEYLKGGEYDARLDVIGEPEDGVD
ncbi:hypothetical protein [Coleofasciculus sp. E2-BRE-01]|uniref:hypothetical protein n=1 Tax=Coleofasciculus sp. E2-BRE-01 TaxID=3069524 RepID=UPI0032FEA94A